MGAINKSLFLMSFCLLLIAQGCAVGNKYNFADTRADLQVASGGQSTVAVATLDQRQDILSGNLPTHIRWDAACRVRQSLESK